ASGLGPEGRGFESLFTDHIEKKALHCCRAFFVSGDICLGSGGGSWNPSRVEFLFTAHCRKPAFVAGFRCFGIVD
ncbi:hypothetical protein CRN61_05585, partial [Vibrio vulnificus]